MEGILTKEQEAAGWSVREFGNEAVELSFHGKRKVVFTPAAEAHTIRTVAERLMALEAKKGVKA